MKNIPVEDIMTTAVYRVTPDMTIREVIALLIQRKIHGAPIVDQTDHVLSVISEGDAMHLAASDGLDTTVAGVLWKLKKQHQVITLERKADYTEAYKLFLKHGIHRIIVTDKNGRLQGLISRSNILKILIQTRPTARTA
jgi:predicted transcriptional regulator